MKSSIKSTLKRFLPPTGKRFTFEINQLKGDLDRIAKEQKVIQNQNAEILWSHVWHDTIRSIEWAEELPSLSPGRWAVGYNYLYIMTRVLNDIKPHRVLDLGLGISSTLITKYFNYYHYIDGMHTIIENNPEWIKFYTGSHEVSEESHIILLNRVIREHDGSEYYAYENLPEAIQGHQYSVISIDGPRGGRRHSRRDILDLIPSVLEDSFVIVMDDSQRGGEKETLRELEQKLSINGISFCKADYPGLSNCCVIVSSDNEFICSL